MKLAIVGFGIQGRKRLASAEADSRLYQAKHQGRNRVIGPDDLQ